MQSYCVTLAGFSRLLRAFYETADVGYVTLYVLWFVLVSDLLMLPTVIILFALLVLR